MATICRIFSGVPHFPLPLRLGQTCNRLHFNRLENCVLVNRGMKRYVVPVKIAMKNRKDAMNPQPPQRRSTFPEFNYNAEIFAFGKRVGEEFNKDLLQRAFVERSYIVMEEEKQKNVGIEEPEIHLKDNIEFAEKGAMLIFNFCKRYLRTVYPRFPEEGICAVSEYLLSDEVLGDISKHLGTSDIILTSENPPSVRTLADVLKAIVYALEQSSGEERTNDFVRDFIITYLSGKDISELWEIKNPESVLASIFDKDGKGKIEPRLIGDAGKNTILAVFRVGLYCNKELIGIGFGETISIAREIAALDGLRRLFNLTERARPIPFDLRLASGKHEPFANVSIEDWCEKNIKSMMALDH